MSKSIIEENLILDLNDKEKIAETIGKIQEACLQANPQVELVDASGIVQTVKNENGELETTLNLGDPETHQLITFPIFDGRGETAKLVYSVIAIVPRFEIALSTEVGKNFLKQSYEAVVIKKVRDNVRNAAANKRVYTAPISVEDFLSTSRATTGSEAFKSIVADLVKGLRERFKKFPTANAIITQKTLIEAFKSEALAKQVFSFMVNPQTGETILGGILEKVREQLANKGEPTVLVDSMLATRNQTTIDESADESADLFDLDGLLA